MIDEFLKQGNVLAVVGVSQNKEKWGRKIYETLKRDGFKTYPLNPKADKIGEDKCYSSLEDLPEKPDVVISAVPPVVTEKVVDEMREQKISRIWMQPGSESDKAIKDANDAGIQVIANACFIVDGLKEEF